MLEFPKFKGKINCENVPLSERVRIDDFEIQGRLSDEEIIKIIRSKEPKTYSI